MGKNTFFNSPQKADPQIFGLIPKSQIRKFLKSVSPQVAYPQNFMTNPQIANPQMS